MKTLALELSAARGSIAWLDGSAEFAREWENDRKNSAPFFENLSAVVKKFGQPDRVVVGLGPGSYAGTRIAISAAVGLAFPAGGRSAETSMALIGFPSICAMEGDDYFVIGDARRKSFFFAHICRNAIAEGPSLSTEGELQERLGCIDSHTPVFASEDLSQFPRVAIRYPSAMILARLAQSADHGFSLPPLEPMYLREPHITLPK